MYSQVVEERHSEAVQCSIAVVLCIVFLGKVFSHMGNRHDCLKFRIPMLNSNNSMLEAMSWSLRRNSNLAICTYSRLDLTTLDSRTLCAQKPLKLTLVQLWASVFTQCAYLFCYIASECSGHGGEFIRSQKTHLRSQKKESCAGAFHPSPPLPKDFINVSFEPNLWCYFLTLSPSMPAFVWIMFWKYWRV